MYEQGTPEREAWEMGRDDGLAAATWFDTFASPEDAIALLRGIEDGDPMILDRLPAPDLSGQLADRMTGSDLVAIVMPDATDEDRENAFMDICDAYDLGFYEASGDHIVTAAHRYLEG